MMRSRTQLDTRLDLSRRFTFCDGLAVNTLAFLHVGSLSDRLCAENMLLCLYSPLHFGGRTPRFERISLYSLQLPLLLVPLRTRLRSLIGLRRRKTLGNRSVVHFLAFMHDSLPCIQGVRVRRCEVLLLCAFTLLLSVGTRFALLALILLFHRLILALSRRGLYGLCTLCRCRPFSPSTPHLLPVHEVACCNYDAKEHHNNPKC
mmetsp:Transcript_47726/g.78992  ORF Transcript_47726/g.78992 Transcript_47726/m.78992 type:complete len:204 (-) Transcript_47726:312-923(-)